MRRFIIRWALMAASVAPLGCGVAVPLATASAAATPACTTTVNWIGLPGDGYAGGQTVQLEFSNTGKVTCTLYGHPGVAQMDAGRQVGRPATWTGTPATVTLKPGATAHAVLTLHNAGALCAKPQTSTYLNVIAPGQRTAFPDPFQSRTCPGKSVMHVNPVRPGVGVPFYTSSRPPFRHRRPCSPALVLPAGRAAGSPGATPRAPIAPGLPSVVLDGQSRSACPGRGSTVIFRSVATSNVPRTRRHLARPRSCTMPLTKPGASEMNNPSKDNSEPGYAAANSLRPRSVSREGGDLSMLCIATSE